MKTLELIHGIKMGMVEENMTKYNLLFADAIHVSSCKIHDIENIAANDHDLERVGFLNLWKP